MKRFTDSGIWGKTWHRKWPAKIKLLWLYLRDNCDQAGVWQADWELASLQIGEVVGPEDLARLNEGQSEGDSARVEVLENGKIWVTGYMAFQYGKLSSKCRAHDPVFRLIEKHSLLDRVSNSLYDRLGHNVSSEFPKKLLPLPPQDSLSHRLQEEEEEEEEDSSLSSQKKKGEWGTKNGDEKLTSKIRAAWEKLDHKLIPIPEERFSAACGLHPMADFEAAVAEMNTLAVCEVGGVRNTWRFVTYRLSASEMACTKAKEPEKQPVSAVSEQKRVQEQAGDEFSASPKTSRMPQDQPEGVQTCRRSGRGGVRGVQGKAEATAGKVEG